MIKRRGPAPTQHTTPQTKIAIKNVNILDGKGLSQPATVVIENGLISHSGHSHDAGEVIDTCGEVLLPVLIDCHIHVGSLAHAETIRGYGIGAGMDMGCNLAAADCNALNVGVGYPYIKLSYDGAASPFGATAKLGLFKLRSLVANVSAPAAHLSRQVANNAS